MFDINELASMQVGLASPEEIRSWSHGEVTKPETVNYRSQKPEAGGLFCEKIFGPSKDYECHCGKYKKIRYQGITCEKCGVEVISREWRRERFGHIDLVSPCSHIWYLKGIPSRMGLILNMSPKQLEEIIYFAAHVCLDPGTSNVLHKKDFLNEAQARVIFGEAITDIINEGKIEEGSADFERATQMLEHFKDMSYSFDFFSSAAFIKKYTGAEFGEGAASIKQLLSEVNLDEEYKSIQAELKDASVANRLKLAKRLEVVQAFKTSGQKPEWMILDVLPVIPPDLRPMLQLDGGRFAASDLNDLYRRVISRNNRLKKLIQMNAPRVIMSNEKRMLQEAVDALIDNGRRTKAVTGTSGRPLKSLSSGLKGKQGRFRQNLLGKRVDYSGRSVIAVGPDLKMYQCGIPREMAVNLLRPFIASILIKRGYVTAHKQADKYIDRYEPVVLDIVEEIVSDHPVLLNRAPTLHRLGIQAFQPKLVDGHAIRLHPLVCTGFNADFDGDQMAIHVPLTKEAQEEALNLMLASNNILGPKDGKPICIPSQDMVLGNYYMTTEESKQDFLDRARDLRALAIQDPREAEANEEEAQKFERYAEMEGRVFSSVKEVKIAYDNKVISLHNRIAIRTSTLHKEFVDGKGFPKGTEDKYLATTVGKVLFNEIFPDDFNYINSSADDIKAPIELTIKAVESLNDYQTAIKVEGAEDFIVVPSSYELKVKAGQKVEKGAILAKYTDKSMYIAKGTNIPEYIAAQPLKTPIKKKQLGKIIDDIFRAYDMGNPEDTAMSPSKTSAILDKIKDQGFKYSTLSSVTVALSDIKTLDKKEAIYNKGQEKVDQINELYEVEGLISDKERHDSVVKVWDSVREDIKKIVAEYLLVDKRNPLVIMSDSGARGSVDNFMQLIGMKGCVANPKNEVIELPIHNSYREGLSVSEFFINTHGARKGSADTALKTADSGYLTRRLVDVAQDVVVREVDCHCDHGFKVREIRDTARDTVITKLESRLAGRYSMHDIVNPTTGEVIVEGNHLISDEEASTIAKSGIKEVEIRTLFTCQTKNGVCQHCYGRNMATGRLVQLGEAVGIMAAQSIGEPGTQLTMRVFHTGGMAGSDITQGLPRVQELVEARNPKGEAKISEISGHITDIKQDGTRYVVTVQSNVDSTIESEMPEVKEYVTPYGARLRVKVGDLIDAGGKITEGAINPKELLDVSDVEKVEVYMIKEIQKVYSAQGIGISDKHLEVIIRQMLRKMIIIDGGDTNLLPGTRVDCDKFTVENQEALINGKRPAVGHPLILGITKAALETESFLSAASFQETTRVLTDAAIKAKLDPLHGLKENVITGKLIPAGTGLLTPAEESERIKDFTVKGKMDTVKAQYREAHDRNVPTED